MSNESSLSSAELNSRIRILEDNIRQLIEQAAAASGERNESRIADRLSQQHEELEKLTRERDARLGGIFNMGGAAVANYVSVLERIK